MYVPFAAQRAFHESDVTNLLALGNRGGGKSVMMRFDAHARALACPGSSLILIRKTYKQLLESHVYFQGLPWGSLKREMELLGGYFNKTDYICHYPNNSKLFLSYVGHESDALNLLSAEFVGAYFDELSTIPWDYFIKLAASVRVPRGSGWKAVVRAATNPLGESAADVMKYFVYKDVDPIDEPDYNPDDWGYIRINMEDNIHLDVEQYKKRFAALPDYLKKAWLYGEYAEENALFSFYPTKDGKPYHVINELDLEGIVKKARIFRVYDHGYKPDPAYCAWIAHLGNRYVVFHEKTWYETVVSDIATSMKEIDTELGLSRVQTTYCDPTIDIKTGQDYRTIKDIFEMSGIGMDCSVNNREQFASAIHTALAEEVEPGIPRLQIYSKGCPYLIRAIPMQRFNSRRPLAMDDQKHDHPVVALAYFLISHAADESRTFVQKPIKPWMRPKRDSRLVLGSESVRGTI